MRGLTRTVGNEIDEFVTEALRNNLVGTPLDLAVLNLARGRDTGIPSLNAARRDFYDANRRHLGQALYELGRPRAAHQASRIADQLHRRLRHASALLAADVDTLADKRAVATALVLGGTATINAGTASERIFTPSMPTASTS